MSSAAKDDILVDISDGHNHDEPNSPLIDQNKIPNDDTNDCPESSGVVNSHLDSSVLKGTSSGTPTRDQIEILTESQMELGKELEACEASSLLPPRHSEERRTRSLMQVLGGVEDSWEGGEGSVQIDTLGDVTPKHRHRSRSQGGVINQIKQDIKKQMTSVESLKKSDSVLSFSTDEVGNSSSASANVSESESDYEYGASQECDNSTNMSSSITDTMQKLKIMRSDSLISESDSDLEYVQSDDWKNKRKHVFVLSESGKPIYSRYGNEEKLVTVYGVMQALVSFIAHGGQRDVLKMIVAGDRRFVFLIKEHLTLVAVTSGEESVRHLHIQLNYVYNQILCVLTLTSLNKIFKDRVNFDLRRMLSGTEKFIDNLLNVIDRDPSYILGAVRCLPLQSSVRDTFTQTIVQCCSKVKDLVFAVVVSHNQLVSSVRMKKFILHSLDLHLLLNMVQSSDSFKTAESWLPVCLPKFDSSGFLYAYISYLDEPCNTCLLLLTVDSEHFPILSDCKTRIVERLNRYSCLQSIAESVSSHGYSTQQVGMPELWHFVYKSKSSGHMTSPEPTAPYVTDVQRHRLQDLYMSIHGRMHCAHRPLRILYQTYAYESILGWITQGFELYAVFSPLSDKKTAISTVYKLLRWIKREESRLFILNQSTF